MEGAVLIAERWILAALRNHRFFSLAELKQAIGQELVKFNDRKLQKLDVSRRELFEKTDTPSLKPLPVRRYEFADWKKVRVNIDYHIEIDGCYYSVPHILRGEQVDLRITHVAIEVLHKNHRVAGHIRRYKKGGVHHPAGAYAQSAPEVS